MHIQDPDQRAWIQDRVEVPHDKPERSEQLRILRKLNEAEALESFLQTKYVGQKRFSLEGGSRSSRCWTPSWTVPPARASTRSPSACRTAAGSTS
jgi:hypothetical protein